MTYQNYNTNLSLITLITVLSIIDFELTEIAINNNIATEANPMLSYVINATGTITSILWVKIIALLTITILFFTTQTHPAWQLQRIQSLLIFTNMVYIGIIAYTSYIILFFL